MNKHQQLREDLYDEDKLVQHDLRIMSAITDLDSPDVVRLVLEDAYGSLNGRYEPERPVDPDLLVGKVFKIWGYAFNHENPAAGIDVGFIEPAESPDPSLLLVPQSACAEAAVPALHSMINLTEAMTTRPIADFVNRVLGSDEIYPYFFKAKASPFSHHNFEGGLAVHSADCAMIVSALSDSHFSGCVGRELAIAAAMLHDLGKIAWAGSNYVNPLLQHESRGLVLASDALKRLRADTDSGTADMAIYLLSKESKLENASCPEAVAVALADRLSATRNGQSMAFEHRARKMLTAGRQSGSFNKRYIRVVDPLPDAEGPGASPAA